MALIQPRKNDNKMEVTTELRPNESTGDIDQQIIWIWIQDVFDELKDKRKTLKKHLQKVERKE